MKLTVIGTTGSMSGPSRRHRPTWFRLAASTRDPGEERTFSLVCDMGPGSFGALWAHVCPCELDALALSHCHADHMGDIISLQVYRKWGPGAAAFALPLYGPAETLRRVRQIEDAPDDEAYEVEFAFTHMQLGEAYQVGPMTIRPYRALHPVEAYGLRIEGPSEEDPERLVSLFYTATPTCATRSSKAPAGLTCSSVRSASRATRPSRTCTWDGYARGARSPREPEWAA